MEEIKEHFVQLHAQITRDNEHKMHTLQSRILLQSRIKKTKTTIINEALQQYLDFELDKYGK